MAGTDAQIVPVQEMEHVVMRADNCVLIMATVYGGFAYRHNFLPAFGDELRNANNTSIDDMFHRASHTVSLRQESYGRQRPEFRSVGRCTLRL